MLLIGEWWFLLVLMAVSMISGSVGALGHGATASSLPTGTLI